MANTQAMCNTFKQDLLNGLHAFGSTVVRGTTTKDNFKAALYLTSATINASTTQYTTTGEVSSSGTNYPAGGVAVTFATAPTVTSGVAHITPSASITFPNVTLGTAFDSVLIYNDTATGKNAVSVHYFGSQTVSAGTFTLTMPTNDNLTGLIRLT